MDYYRARLAIDSGILLVAGSRPGLVRRRDIADRQSARRSMAATLRPVICCRDWQRLPRYGPGPRDTSRIPTIDAAPRRPHSKRRPPTACAHDSSIFRRFSRPRMARMGDNRQRHRRTNDRSAARCVAHLRLAARAAAPFADSGELVDRLGNVARVVLHVCRARRRKSHTSTDNAPIMIGIVARTAPR